MWRSPTAEYAIRAPKFIMEIFLCAPKAFWLNFNSLALPINVFKNKSVTIFPGQKSMPPGVHLGTFQVHLHLQKVMMHPRFR